MKVKDPAMIAIKLLSAESLSESIRTGGKETRVKIIRASAKLFATQTFNGTSMQDIADGASISRSNIYYHYKSKKNILADIYIWLLERDLEILHAIVKMNKPPLDSLSLIIWCLVKAGSIDKWERSLMAERLDPRDSVPKQDRETILNTLQESTRIIKKVISDCIDSRLIEKSFDPSATVQMILSLVNKLPVWYSDQGRFTSDEIADLAVELLINGVRIRN